MRRRGTPVSREAPYEEVWTDAVTVVAPSYGLCAQNGSPGAQRRHGQQYRRAGGRVSACRSPERPTTRGLL